MSYVDQYRLVHSTSAYGNTSHKKAAYLLPHIGVLQPRSIIDYGCGQSSLAELLSELPGVETVHRYDPAIPAFSARPERVWDLLVNVDVLEHIPESDLDSVLSDMRATALDAIFIIDTRLAKKVLPNGQNAHATVKPRRWWRERLARHYDYLESFHCIPLTRACFKTWKTAAPDHVRILARSLSIDLGRKLRKRGLL